MKAAFTFWNGRISPVFDVAGQVLLVESRQGTVFQKTVSSLPTASAMEKLAFLSGERIDILVCGAISRPVLYAAEACGIKVYPFCSGEVDELIRAWLEERLEQGHYAMPGCGRGRHRRQSCNGRRGGRRCFGSQKGKSVKGTGGDDAKM